MPRKETRRKNGFRQKAKPSTSTQEVDALMGEEEKNIKQKQEQNKETGTGPPTQLPGPIYIIVILYSAQVAVLTTDMGGGNNKQL